MKKKIHTTKYQFSIENKEDTNRFNKNFTFYVSKLYVFQCQC